MTTLRVTLQCAKLRLLLWRYLATRATGRLVRWAADNWRPPDENVTAP